MSALDHFWLGFHFYKMKVVCDPVQPGVGQAACHGLDFLASQLSRNGLEVHAYVHGLYQHLAASDLAVVQGGLTTCMELTAARRPFLYFPLAHHFEHTVAITPDGPEVFTLLDGARQQDWLPAAAQRR